MNIIKAFSQIRQLLLDSGMSPNDIDLLQNQLQDSVNNVDPPKIAIIGFTGVGKSSTLNALFNAGQPTSDVRACTQKAKGFTGDIEQYTGTKGTVLIYDMPGLGESIIKDQQHYQIYSRILPNVDVIVWTFHAEDRAMAPMQSALLKLIETIGEDFTKKLIFAINKADAIAPGELYWNEQFNIPSPEQIKNLTEFSSNVAEKIHEVLPQWNGPIIFYSAKRRYHLDQLMTSMIEVMPSDRKWVMNNLADVANYTELIDPDYLPYIQSLFNSKASNAE